MMNNQLLNDPKMLIEQLQMLQSHNPDAIQQYGWTQIEPIQEQVVGIMAESAEVAVLVVKILDKR